MKKLRAQVGVNDNLDYRNLNDPRVKYHARSSVGWWRLLVRSSRRKPNLANFQSRRTYGSAWRTSGACLSFEERKRESSSFVPHRGASYFRPILERKRERQTVSGSRSSEKYIFLRARLSSFHSDYLQRQAAGRVVERSKKKYVCTFFE